MSQNLENKEATGVHPSILQFIAWCKRFELKPCKIESILLYQDYQKLCVSYQRLWEVQHASLSD